MLRAVRNAVGAARGAAPRPFRKHTFASARVVESAETAALKAKLRRNVKIASVSAAVLTILPAYFYVTNLMSTTLPEHAASVVGAWEALDKDGEACRLRFSKYNMVAVESPDVHQRGPVTWLPAQAGFVASPLPILSFLGEDVTHTVTTWPREGADDVLVVDGLQYRRIA